jgi:hypothetical protein
VDADFLRSTEPSGCVENALLRSPGGGGAVGGFLRSAEPNGCVEYALLRSAAARSGEPGGGGGTLDDLVRGVASGTGGGTLAPARRDGTPLCGCVPDASAGAATTPCAPDGAFVRAAMIGCSPVPSFVRVFRIE